MNARSDRSARVRTRAAAPEPSPAFGTRTLVAVALRPAGFTVAALAVVVVLTLVLGGSELTGTFGAVAALWLAVHHVAIPIDGVTIGVTPLAATAALGYGAFRSTVAGLRAAPNRRLQRQVMGAAVGGPLLVTLVAVAVVADAAQVIALDNPNVLAALCWTAVVHGLALGAAVARTRWSELTRMRFGWLTAGVRPALVAAATLLAAGSAAYAIAVLAHWSQVGALLHTDDGLSGTLGLFLISVVYLPNAVVAATMAFTGASVAVGDVSFGVFGTIGGQLPAVPLLGAVPSGAGGGLWPVLLVLPALVGVWLGRTVARSAPPGRAPYVAMASSAGVAVLFAVLGVFSGGRLGAFGQVDVQWWAGSLLMFGWLMLPAVLVVTVSGARGARAERVDDAVETAERVADELAGDAEVETVDDDTELEVPQVVSQSEPDDAAPIELQGVEATGPDDVGDSDVSPIGGADSDQDVERS